MCPVHIHQDTSRYIKIHQDTSRYIKIHAYIKMHQDTFVSGTSIYHRMYLTKGNVSSFLNKFKIHSRYIQDTFKIHSRYNVS